MSKKKRSTKSPKTSHKSKKSRDLSLDLLRGVAVFLMIVTHVDGIFYSGSFFGFNLLSWLGASVCFTIFLFVSASVSGILIEKDKIDKVKMITRLVKFLLAYYVTAFILIALKFGVNYAINNIGGIITFTYVPEFIEFILAFILFGLLIVLIPKRWLRYMTDPKVLVPLSIVVFILSKVIYSLDTVSEALIALKFMLTGHLDLHAFGVLSYFPVFAIGLWWGGIRAKSKIRSDRYTKISAFVVFYIYLFLVLSGISNGNRFPPSLAFLAFGVAFSLGFLVIADRLMKFENISKSVIFMGKNAFDYYILHIILLFIVAYLVGWTMFGEISTVLVASFTFSVSTLLILLRKALDKRLFTSHPH